MPRTAAPASVTRRASSRSLVTTVTVRPAAIEAHGLARRSRRRRMPPPSRPRHPPRRRPRHAPGPRRPRPIRGTTCARAGRARLPGCPSAASRPIRAMSRRGGRRRDRATTRLARSPPRSRHPPRPRVAHRAAARSTRPRRGEPRVQRLVGDLVGRNPRELAALGVADRRLERAHDVADQRRVATSSRDRARSAVAAGPPHPDTPASSAASRSAPSLADSPSCRAPPGSAQVSPKWSTTRGAAAARRGAASRASSPAAPNAPQYRSPVGSDHPRVAGIARPDRAAGLTGRGARCVTCPPCHTRVPPALDRTAPATHTATRRPGEYSDGE